MPQTINETLPIAPVDVMALAHEAGRLVVGMQERGLGEIRTKSTDVDLVTEADTECERFLAEGLAALLPGADFWGEESNRSPDSEYYWLVDPIDGTVNYATSVPFYSISIALNREDETLFGLVLKLPSGELFWAERGQGAHRIRPDGREDRLQVNHVDRLGDAMLTTGFPYHRTQHADNNAAEFTQMLTQARSVRCLGSAAIELALVAAGATTAHWEGWLKPWDVAAGKLLIEEAGGVLTTYSGEPYTFGKVSCIASNGQSQLHSALVKNLRSARETLAERLFEE
ncbi:MAG: inositol monophosphatase [Caldilineaceae bacterium]|nr:inositol monophosphatase [Caldilineaceae bacterium]